MGIKDEKLTNQLPQVVRVATTTF